MTIRNTQKFLQNFHKDIIKAEEIRKESLNKIINEEKETKNAEEISNETIANFTNIIKEISQNKEKNTPTKNKKKKIVE